MSYKGKAYAAPFYGESSFTMYRIDLVEEAGSEMPERPAWDLIKEAGSKYGWANVPSGAHRELYDNFDCLKAAPFAGLTLELMKNAAPQPPAGQPMPCEGIRYVGLPSFQSIGTAVGYQMDYALTGDITAKKALENSQWVTRRVIKRIDKIEDTQSSN